MAGQHRPRARGLTLVEVLMTLAIIATLVAITVPTVLWARAAAGQNADEIRKLRIAIQVYQ